MVLGFEFGFYEANIFLNLKKSLLKIGKIDCFLSKKKIGSKPVILKGFPLIYNRVTIGGL